MHDGGGGGGGFTGGSGFTGDQHSGHAASGHSGGVHSSGVHSGGGHGSSGAGGFDPSRQRDPYPDPLDPHGPMGMPKIVSRAAGRLGHGQQGGGNVAAVIFVLSVLAIIIAFGVVFIAGGH